MRTTSALILAGLLLGTVTATADPPVVAAADVSVVPRPAPGKAVEMRAVKGKINKFSPGKTAKAARWLLIDTTDADLDTNGLLASFTASKDGVYRLVLATDDDLVLILLTVGDPPPPGPGPGPKPPDPPPPSPLLDKLKAAFDADPMPLADRRAKAVKLAALYRQAAILSRSNAVPTGSELIRRVREAGATLLDDPGNEQGDPTVLVPVRAVVGTELAAILGKEADATTPLTADQRAATTKLFDAAAVILDSF